MGEPMVAHEPPPSAAVRQPKRTEPAKPGSAATANVPCRLFQLDGGAGFLELRLDPAWGNPWFPHEPPPSAAVRQPKRTEPGIARLRGERQRSVSTISARRWR